MNTLQPIENKKRVVTYLFDGGNLQPLHTAKPRVFTILTILEPVRYAFPARLLPKTRSANQNTGTQIPLRPIPVC